MGSFEDLSAHTELYSAVMLSLISCTTPDEPGLMNSRLEELARAFSTTVPDTAASRMTLLVMLRAVRL
jgi:hypothetical protein